jgi:hypothetical protein
VDEAAGQLTKINDVDKLSRAPISVKNRGEIFTSPRFPVQLRMIFNESSEW